MTDINDMFPSKYLKASDADPQLTLTIARVVQEKMKNRDGEEETKPVIYFNENEKGMVLNKTNARTLSDLFGPTIELWKGETVILAAVEVDAFGETTRALRFKKETAISTRDQLLKRYNDLFNEATTLEIENIDTYILTNDASEQTIIELGKSLRKTVEAARNF